MTGVRNCEHCGKPLVRRRCRDGRIAEGPKAFGLRKHCGRVCEKKAAGAYWSEAAVKEVLRLKSVGATTAQIAERMTGAFGLGKVSRNMVIHRLRHPYPTGEEPDLQPAAEKADPEPALALAVRTDKPPGRCRHGDCQFPRQPGRDFCAEHIRALICDRLPRRNGTLDIFQGEAA